jgi:hypothetical protein
MTFDSLGQPVPPPEGPDNGSAWKFNHAKAYWYPVQQVRKKYRDENWPLYQALTTEMEKEGIDVDIMDQVWGFPEPGKTDLPPEAALPTGLRWPDDLDTILNQSPDPYKDLSVMDLLNEPEYQNPPPPEPPPQDAGPSQGGLEPGDDLDTWIAFFDAVNADAAAGERQDSGGGSSNGHGRWVRTKKVP